MSDPADPGPGSSNAPADERGERRTPRRTDTKDPRRARERALKILFQADVRGDAAAETLARLVDDPHARAMLDDLDELTEEQPTRSRAADTGDDEATQGRTSAPRLDGFTRSLVLGVADHREEIDGLISTYARRWQISRMPVIDRTVLRLATFELLHESTPPAVVIHEAVTLAKQLSTDDSGRYVNGVLESIRKDVSGRRTQEHRPSA